MRHPSVLIAVFLLGSLAASPRLMGADPWLQSPETQQLQDRDKSAIRRILTDQAAAWNAHDLPQFMATYWNSEQLSFSSGGKTTRGWKATLERYRQRYSDAKQMGTLKFTDLEVHELSSQAAYVLGRWQLKREGETMDGNFTLIVRKIEGAWKIVHDHTSLDEGS